jgi:hypothetical protein
MKLARLVVLPIVTRVSRRYPGVALGLVVWRWLRRRRDRRSRHVVRIGRNEALTIERKERTS